MINLDNLKVIGIHKGRSIDKKINYGSLIRMPIDEFFEKLKNFKIEGTMTLKKSIENKSKKNIDGETITIRYKIIDKYRIFLFGEDFVNNNKELCTMIINKKEYKICQYYSTGNLELNNTLEIKLKGIKRVTNMSCMFYGCLSLISLPDISEIDTKNVIDMSYMFYECELLKSLPDISKWDTKNVTNMSHMFDGCFSLSSLPDISKWNTENLKNKSNMFARCKNSLNIPPEFQDKWYRFFW